MRFLSKYGRFGLLVQRDIVENYATGASQIVQSQVMAQFREGGMQPEERELAISRWFFEGSYQELDEVHTVPPDYRIGVFDSEQAQAQHGWSDEIREKVEQALIQHSQKLEDVLVVPATVIPPPWPRYDDYSGTPAALVRKLVDEGHSLDAVLTYEKATQKREKIIAAIEEAISDPSIEYEEEVVG